MGHKICPRAGVAGEEGDKCRWVSWQEEAEVMSIVTMYSDSHTNNKLVDLLLDARSTLSLPSPRLRRSLLRAGMLAGIIEGGWPRIKSLPNPPFNIGGRCRDSFN